MRKNLNRLISVLTAGVLTLSVFAPVTDVAAATKNKVVEIPVNFTNTDWDADWETNSRTEAYLWECSEPSAYSDSYTVSYKLYVPVSFMKKESTVNIGSSLNFNDTSEEEWQWVGWSECPSLELHEDLSLTYWDEENKKDVPVDYATVKKTGDFYVISYKAANKIVQKEENVPAELSADKNYAVNLNIALKGIYITAKSSAIYLDDLKITKADGTVILDKNYTSDKKVDGEAKIAPKLGESEGKALKLATITDNKVLTVKSTKATVKVGKKVKISATATPATKITYASSNKKVATVDAKGTVTGKKAGKATISVKANGKTVKVAITVKKK